MLACRLGGGSSRDSWTLRRQVRHSSSAATATPVRTYAEEHTIEVYNFDSTSVSNTVARSNTSHGEEYVELVMPAGADSNDSRKIGTEAEDTTNARILRINANIDPCHNPAAESMPNIGIETRSSVGQKEGSSKLTWEHILEHLEKTTQKRRPDSRYVEIAGPEPQLLELYYHLLHNPQHNVDIDLPVRRIGDMTSHMTIKGHSHVLHRAVEYIQRDQNPELELPYTRDVSTGKRIVLMHTQAETPVFERDKRRGLVRFIAPARRPEDVPIPRSWTVSSFARYIESLIAARSPEVLRAGKSAQLHREGVLMDLLRSTETHSVLSYAAFYSVLSFLMRHQRYNTAWALIELMRSLDLHPGSTFYNLMLLTAATNQDIKMFDRLLSTMRSDQVQPDAGTWVALLMASSSVEFKQSVMRKMFDNGLSAQSVFETKTAPMIIPYSLLPFLETGGDIPEFFDILDECWGPNWVTDDAVSQMVDVLGGRGAILEAVRLVNKLAQERDYRVSKGPLHILLKHCRRTNSADIAVWLVKYAAEIWRVSVKDRIIFSQLFKTAYNARMHNLVRVIWQYAGAAGQLDNHMRTRIFQSLNARCRPDLDSVNGRWTASFGAVACGIDPVAAQLTPDQILDGQRGLFENVKPKMSFASKVVEALFLDKDWTEQQVKKNRGTTWRIVNAVTIDMKPLVKPTRTNSSVFTSRRLYRPQRRLAHRSRASNLSRSSLYA